MNNTSSFEKICYKNNFLSEVIVRIDLVSPILELMNNIPKELSKIILNYFPIDEPKRGLIQEIKIDKEKVSSQKEEFTEWNFFGKEREKRFVITKGAFLIIYKKYKEYENLRNEFVDVADNIFKTFDQYQPSRLGLRYINQIHIEDNENPLDFSKYIEKRLLGLFDYSVEGAKPTRIFNNIELSFDNLNLRFQFGVDNPDYPAPILRKIFILDYDANFKGAIEPSDISSSLDKYHSVIQSMFEKSITDELRSKMNE